MEVTKKPISQMFGEVKSNIMDFETERKDDTDKIKNSEHPRKVVVAGPGTGKSYLFSEIIKKKQEEGKNNFLAITFIGKLGDFLADDLCGLAETVTMHSFARTLVFQYCQNWNYYPNIYQIIKEDLEAEDVDSFVIGDENYKEKTKYYRTTGDADVVHYAIQILKNDPNKIPLFDLILVDEYQDFNKEESELVDLLSKKNDIVIVGDDDQALYSFKGSSPDFIREKYHQDNINFESYTLRFCSRCTEVIIKYFHKLAESFNLNNPENGRIEKEYICYLPDKKRDSDINSKIHLIVNCPPGMIAYKIKDELSSLTKSQKIKNVLIIGEGQSCVSLLKTITQQLKDYGFKNIDSRYIENILPLKNDIIDAYKFINRDESSLIGWRILSNPTDQAEKDNHVKNAKTLNLIIEGTPSKLKALNHKNIWNLEKEIECWDINENKKDLSCDELENIIHKEQCDLIRKKILINELKKDNIYLPRPLLNLNVTICNILNSKGLGADIVFLVGFDQGKFPSKEKVDDSEIYQMLVALTRAKKRIYLINTVGSKVSKFIDYIDENDLNLKRVEMKK
jgi:superfamily I DNA/RNA helicase